ncbi:MAG: hypothetical protein HDS39_00225 [Bacteroides sp.]|nr:hypothetical protein [Bacteroides sp.]
MKNIILNQRAEPRKRELDALIEAAEELYGDDLLVITNDQNECVDFKGKEIRVISVDRF